MQISKKTFNLPMVLTHLMAHRDGECVAHSLDFDIVCIAPTEKEAWEKLCSSIKSYVEYGLSNDWQDHIIFPAPQEFWDKLTPQTPVQLRPAITIAGQERKVVEAELHEDCAAA